MTLEIRTNDLQATDVIIRDMGLVIEANGGSTLLETKQEIALAQQSQDLIDYCTDDAYGTDGSTLILNEGGTADVEQDLVEAVLAGEGAEKTVFSPINLSNSLIGEYNTASIPKNSSGNISFTVPRDLIILTSLDLIGIPETTQTGANIDLSSTYAGTGEVYNNHAETDTVITYDLVAGVLNELDISSVFSELAGGDKCGLGIVHNSLSGKIDYLGVRLIYR
jgi:hypothetical protein